MFQLVHFMLKHLSTSAKISGIYSRCYLQNTIFNLFTIQHGMPRVQLCCLIHRQFKNKLLRLTDPHFGSWTRLQTWIFVWCFVFIFSTLQTKYQQVKNENPSTELLNPLTRRIPKRGSSTNRNHIDRTVLLYWHCIDLELIIYLYIHSPNYLTTEIIWPTGFLMRIICS